MESPASSVSISSSRRPFRELLSPRNLNTSIDSPRFLPPRSPRFLKSGTPSPTACSTPPSHRSPGGSYVFMPREGNDPGREAVSTAKNYTVLIPPTPDPGFLAAPKTGDMASAMFTGGFQSVTRGHVMDQMKEAKVVMTLSCAIAGCDGKAMKDEMGEDLSPCECAFRICRDCYFDAINNGGKCPGCKEMYKVLDIEGPNAETLPLPAPRRLSLLRSNQPGSMKQDFDHTRWLYETKGTYGYGNALWPKDDTYFGDGMPSSFKDKARRPLTRKTNVSAAILSPYRLLVFVRLAALGLFITWRIRHPNPEAMWLWGLSIVCELWFAFSWILDQLPKLCPVNRTTNLAVLKDEFERPTAKNPKGRSDLPGIDIFVSTADPEKEPSLVTANTILSILAAEYPVEKLCCYLSDDGGSLLTFEALAEAASFSRIWVPFCRKHSIEPRNPEAYFMLKGDPTKNKVRADFVKDRRRVKREYDEFKVRINGLGDAIRRRSDAYNAHEEIRAKRIQVDSGCNPGEPLNVPKATWMADGTHWPGTWLSSGSEHGRGDHAGIIQVMLAPPSTEHLMGSADNDNNLIDTSDCDIRLPMLVYVSREKRAGYDHNKKAGAMNALVRTSAIMSNGAFILNLDCDHYVYNSLAFREGMCFMMDNGGDRIGFVQFPQRFEGIDHNDRYANHNTVFFDVNMRALDGIQGPVYVGTGCLFRRVALYGFDPPRCKTRSCWNRRKTRLTKKNTGISMEENEDDLEAQTLLPKRYGTSTSFVASISNAEFQGRPLSGQGVMLGRPAASLISPREPLDAATVAEAINVISCWYEDKTEWGQNVGWTYGSVTEDVVTGYTMHNKGWKSVYCVTKRDAFRGTAPINLTDRLHQVLRWATGSVEIFYSRNNALFASTRMKFLQRIAYLNVGIYPFTSIFLTVYCFLPALSLLTGKFIVQTLNVTFLVYLLIITVTICLLAVLEIRWSGITLDEWWRNEQFWVIGGTSAHLVAVFQGLLKVIAGIDISFTLTSKNSGDEDDEFAELYMVKWSALMIPPLTIMMVNLIAIAVAVSRTVYSPVPQWSKLLGGVFFSVWVLFHLYPFSKGLMGRRRRTPTIIFVWSGLLAIVISLLWVSLSSSSLTPDKGMGIGGSFQFP
ncbi:cellulose synthase-like D2-2, glycosyltransferase family 2 protein [Selaginella moellendorffii]|uniref:Cellulose synthase-like D2-2, glycosyltransferase family 2 protein n=1 Tax=Selaginella moellendorffii TaxID=88036 RepID=D8SMF9_SELML|nr:cellulose synthase-like protein D2 [Selaginella moellendorffii]EFJ14485.1 cellulose synthase-like D2-2, glycosyltransferase family 2 protein [Selaginella moellendorffii]|eukprot:XP_002984435.1 cellulose synthase-like protein D2 [Selaginella moellendorffii]